MNIECIDNSNTWRTSLSIGTRYEVLESFISEFDNKEVMVNIVCDDGETRTYRGSRFKLIEGVNDMFQIKLIETKSELTQEPTGIEFNTNEWLINNPNINVITLTIVNMHCLIILYEDKALMRTQVPKTLAIQDKFRVNEIMENTIKDGPTYKCPKCGCVKIKLGYNFCPDCGRAIEVISIEDMMRNRDSAKVRSYPTTMD